MKESEQSQTHVRTYMHTYNTSVHIQCKAIYDETGVRDQFYVVQRSDV
jgi:hypothetical protein